MKIDIKYYLSVVIGITCGLIGGAFILLGVLYLTAETMNYYQQPVHLTGIKIKMPEGGVFP